MDVGSEGGAVDNAKRPVSKLFIFSSHAVSKSHHGDFVYEVPAGDAVTRLDPCFVGVSDLQLGNTGAGMSNVVHGVHDKLYLEIAESGSSNPDLHFAIVTIPAGHYSLSAVYGQIKIKMDAINVPLNSRFNVFPNNQTGGVTISQVSGTGHGFVLYDAPTLLTIDGFAGTGIPLELQQSMQDVWNLPDPKKDSIAFVGAFYYSWARQPAVA